MKMTPLRATLLILSLQAAFGGQNFRSWPIPSANPGVKLMATGPQNTVWFAESTTNKIGVLYTTTGKMQEWDVSSVGSPWGVAVPQSGNPWFTAGNSVATLNVITGAISNYQLPMSNSQPRGIVVAPDGYVYVAELNGPRIAQVSVAGAITEYSNMAINAGPNTIIVGPDGNLWWTEQGNVGHIATMALSTHTITEYAIPQTGTPAPTDLCSFGGYLWVTLQGTNYILRVSLPSVTINSFPVSVNSRLRGIAASVVPGSNGVWFTDQTNNNIGVMNVLGSASYFTLAYTNCTGPGELTTGQDGLVYFAAAQYICQVEPSAAQSIFKVPAFTVAALLVVAISALLH